MSANLGDSAASGSAAPPLTGGDITGASGAGAGAASGGGAAASDNSSTSQGGAAWGSFEEFMAAQTPAQGEGAGQGQAQGAAAGQTPPPAQAGAQPGQQAADAAATAAAAVAGQQQGQPGAQPEDEAAKYNLPADHPLLKEVRDLRTHRGTLENDLKTHRTQLATFNAIGGEKFFEQMKPFFETAWNPQGNAWDYIQAAATLSGIHTPEKIGEAYLDNIVKNPNNFKYAIEKLTGRDDLTPERFKRLVEADKAGEIKLPEENTQWMTAEEKQRHDDAQRRDTELAAREAAIKRQEDERVENDLKIKREAATEEVNKAWTNAAFSVVSELGFVPTRQEFEKTPELAQRKQALTSLVMSAVMYQMVNNPQYQKSVGLAENLAPSVGFVSTPAAEVFRTQLGLMLKQIQPLIAADALGRVQAAEKIASMPGDIASAGAGAGNQNLNAGTPDFYGHTEAEWKKMSWDERDAAYIRHLDARHKQGQVAANA